MKLIEAEKKLARLGLPVLRSSEAAACLGLSRAHASKIMARLAEVGSVRQLIRGHWAMSAGVDRLLIPEYLAAPSPAYISLHTALFHHGMISQMPDVTYAVTIAKTRRYETPLGVFSMHHLDPGFFFGFEIYENSGIKIAMPEKALVDFFYLSPSRSRLFAALPELELPKQFKMARARQMASHIKSRSRRALVEGWLKEL